MKLKIIISSIIIMAASSFVKKDELYLNYLASLNNEGSTFQYYMVIKIKNLNTGETREICTDANGLLGALHHEKNVGYDDKNRYWILSLAKKNKERYFEFKNQDALDNLGLEFYSMSDLENLEKRVNFDSLAKHIVQEKKWKMSYPVQNILYAHALFNRKILTDENNCQGDDLHYVDRERPQD